MEKSVTIVTIVTRDPHGAPGSSPKPHAEGETLN